MLRIHTDHTQTARSTRCLYSGNRPADPPVLATFESMLQSKPAQARRWQPVPGGDEANHRHSGHVSAERALNIRTRIPLGRRAIRWLTAESLISRLVGPCPRKPHELEPSARGSLSCPNVERSCRRPAGDSVMLVVAAYGRWRPLLRSSAGPASCCAHPVRHCSSRPPHRLRRMYRRRHPLQMTCASS